MFFSRFFSIIGYYKILNTVFCAIQDPCYLSNLYIEVCICESQTPNLSLPHPLSPLVTISLFSMYVSLFMFHK